MATIEVTYEDHSRCEVVHTASGQQLKAEIQPAGSSGSRAFSPTDLLAAAFAVGLAIRLAEAAESESLDLKGMRIKVTKEMSADSGERIGQLSALVEVPLQLTSRMKAVFERAARTCPVKESLRAEIETTVQFLFM
jgi:putative redox protein